MGMALSNNDSEFEFLLGVLASEGSFYITFAKDERRRYNVYYGARCRVSMGQFSEDLLVELRNIVDVGQVREEEKGYAWTISSRPELHELKNQIDTHLNSHRSIFESTAKHRAYQKWRKALEELLRPEHRLSQQEVIELARRKETINRVPAAGRSAEELIAIIEDSGGSENQNEQ